MEKTDQEEHPSNEYQIANDNVTNPESSNAAKPFLHFSKWLHVLLGATVGIVLRLIFSAKPGNPYAAMNHAFILFAPLAVGAFTVFMAETQSRRTWGYYIGAGALANVFFVMGTMLILIEGLICAIIILPLFVVIGAIGGLIMGAICRVTNWPKQAIFSLSLLPLILGAMPPDINGNQRISVAERTIITQAAIE